MYLGQPFIPSIFQLFFLLGHIRTFKSKYYKSREVKYRALGGHLDLLNGSDRASLDRLTGPDDDLSILVTYNVSLIKG